MRQIHMNKPNKTSQVKTTNKQNNSANMKGNWNLQTDENDYIHKIKQ